MSHIAGSDQADDILKQFAQVVEERFEKHEREAARDLIQNAFGFLPWELQEGSCVSSMRKGRGS